MVENCPGDGGGVELGLKLCSISHHCAWASVFQLPGESLLRFARGSPEVRPGGNSPGNLRRALIISARERVPCYRTVYFTYHFFFLSLSFFFYFCAQLLSCVQLFATLWTVAYQAPLSMGFSQHEYWGGLPFPPPGGVPDPRTETMSLASPALQAHSWPSEPSEKPKRNVYMCITESLCCTAEINTEL